MARAENSWAIAERFDYGALDEKWALVRLLARLQAELQSPPSARLVVHRGQMTSTHGAFASITEGLAWRASFAVPLAVVRYPGALFEVHSNDHLAVALPAPTSFLTELLVPVSHSRWPGATRRLAAFGCAMAISAPSTPAIAFAFASHHHRHRLGAAPVAQRSTVAAAGRVTKLLDARGEPLKQRHHRVLRSGGAPLVGFERHHPAPGWHHHRHHRDSSRPTEPTEPPERQLSRPPTPPRDQQVTPQPSLGQADAPPNLFVNVQGPPPYLIPIYKWAARRYHLPWEILAAINWIETDYGRDLSVSSAGAIGWMQFMPETWRSYGIDADGRDAANPYDPHDAILAAARYLAANGAPHDLRGAVFAYNHATWYVDKVMAQARAIRTLALDAPLKHGYALPLSARYMHQLGRTDDGVDIETAPDGAPVFSITPGIVTAVASDPAGFGPNYPVVMVTRGPLIGQCIYYGHVASSLVRVGARVRAGQPIAIMGHEGDAASLGHGHIEIGFSSAYGDPVNHHGATAWTPSGAAMRRVLVELAAAFGIAVQ